MPLSREKSCGIPSKPTSSSEVNKTACFFLGVLLSGGLCFTLSGAHFKQQAGERNALTSGHKNGNSSVIESQLPYRTTNRPAGDHKKLADPVRVLGDLARTSPELLARLNLRLFDENLNPILQNWALLGVTQSEIDSLHKKLLEVGEKVKAEELNNFDIIENNPESVMLALRPISEEAVNQLNGHFEQAFETAFSPELAKALSSNFTSSPSPAVAALKRLNRIATVRMTPDELYQKTGKKYTLDIRTLSEDAKVADALKDLDSYSMSRTDLLLDEIPSGWSHLFQH